MDHQRLGLPYWFRSWDVTTHLMAHPEVVTLACVLVPIYLDPAYFRRPGYREWKLKTHLRSCLGLDPRPHPTGDPIAS
ncbi:hypothetical protein [Streptomyces lydicus]|uniref:hypothetical protein n=1 Tax=Streptomyces lydicus TaxID=47763 RepID=UPI0009808C37|nr:hypothetical protein [Streptomyces lydicus]